MLQVVVVALLLSPQAQPPEKCSLSGTVVDSVTGEPLNKVELRLAPLDRQATHVAVTTIRCEGDASRLVDLDPGSYRLEGEAQRLPGNGLRRAQARQRRDSLVRLEAGQSLDRPQVRADARRRDRRDGPRQRRRAAGRRATSTLARLTYLVRQAARGGLRQHEHR